MPWNKLYRGDLARRLQFNESFTLGEDLQFVLDYIALLGREQPGFHYAAVQSPLTFYDCSRDDGTLSTRYHPEVCEIWPQHFAKLNAAAQAAGAPAEDLLPLYRAELRVFAEGAADILRRDPAAPAQRRRKAAAALRCPGCARCWAKCAPRAATAPITCRCAGAACRFCTAWPKPAAPAARFSASWTGPGTTCWADVGSGRSRKIA